MKIITTLHAEQNELETLRNAYNIAVKIIARSVSGSALEREAGNAVCGLSFLINGAEGAICDER